MASEGVDQLKEQFAITKPIKYSPHPIFDIYGDAVEKLDACKKLNLDASFKYILFFGLVRKYKGLDLLLEGFAKFSSDQPNFKLLIAGESYDDWSTYQKIIDDHQLGEKIIRINSFIADKDVKYYFGASEFLALTYHSATQSGVTQIAYSLNLPMLVTDVGDLPNMVKHDAVGQVCKKNSTAIANGLATISNQENINRYRKNILIEKIRFEWSTLCDSLDNL